MNEIENKKLMMFLIPLLLIEVLSSYLLKRGLTSEQSGTMNEGFQVGGFSFSLRNLIMP